MLNEDELIGAFFLYRQEVVRLPRSRSTLVKNFAAQAVIAIENARLLNELRQRTTDLTEALGAADGHVGCASGYRQALPAISSRCSQTMLENAVRICDAKFGNIYRWDGEALHLVATHNAPPAFAEARRRAPLRPGPETPIGRMVATKTVIHVADLAAEQGYIDRDPLSLQPSNLGRTDILGSSDAEGERSDRCVHRLSPGSPSLHRQADRTRQKLRRSSRHRHRERAVAQRTAAAHQRSLDTTSIGAADCYFGGASGHQSAPPAILSQCLLQC